MLIKILGTGCRSCITLENNTKEAVSLLKLDHEVIKITDIIEISKYNVLKTPALVFNEKIVSFGKVLSVDEITKLLDR